MADPKKKPEQSGLRQAKPKKLGLAVPPPLKMPHDELFPQVQPTSSNLQLVEPGNRSKIETGIPHQPATDNDQSVTETSSNQQPVTGNNQSIESPSNAQQPVAYNDQPGSTTRHIEQPATIHNQQQPTAGQHSQPVATEHQQLGNTRQDAQLVDDQPVADTNLSAKPYRSETATGKTSQPVTRPSEYRTPKDEYFLTPNSVSDEVQQVLTDEQFCVYFRLFRLSHGFKQTTCFVGYNALAKALGWKVWKVKKVMPELLATGYVRIVESYNGQGLKGTVYEVFTSRHSQPANDDDQRAGQTGRTSQHNKRDDDPIKQNPHQSAVMRIYQELTGNEFTKADGLQYQKLTGLTADEIELHMRMIHARAASRIGSLAYFVKGIEQALSQGGQPSAGTLEAQYRQIAREIAAAWVGGSQKPSEWIDRLKWRCVQEGLPWNDDIANKVLGL